MNAQLIVVGHGAFKPPLFKVPISEHPVVGKIIHLPIPPINHDQEINTIDKIYKNLKCQVI